MEEYGVTCGAGLPEKMARPVDRWTFGRLMESRAACEVLDAGMLMEWFAGKKALYPQKPLFFLGRAAQCCADLLGLGTIPAELDREHAVFQALVDERDGNVLQCRLIGFAIMSPEVEKSLKNSEYIFMY